MKSIVQSRRDFLSLAGKGMLGAAALATVPAVVTAQADEAIAAPAYPWEWKYVDPNKVLERGYAAFSSHGGCCAGVVAGVVEELAETYGYPYNQVNARMFGNGAGGYGRKLLCGCLGGACAVFGLFCDVADARTLRDEIYTWYENHEFPQYQPEVASPLSVSHSIVCEESVASWSALTGEEFSSPNRLKRCAGLTAETAAKVVEMLNVKYGFTAAPVVEPAEEPAPELGPNEYIGTGDGYNGPVKVKVTMDGDKIANIQVLEHKEDMTNAIDQISAAVMQSQTTEVDVVSNATVTSKALLDAINDALSQVK